MRHAHRIHPAELMKPDLLSEAILVVSAVVLVIGLMFSLSQLLP
jgi:hypothetical protein